MFSDIYAHLLICAVVRLPHPRSGDIQGQETFLAPSAGKQTRNCDKDSSSHDLSIAIRHWDWAVTGQNSEIYICKLTNKCYSQTNSFFERRYSGPGNVSSTLCWQANRQLWQKVLKILFIQSSWGTEIESWKNKMVPLKISKFTISPIVRLLHQGRVKISKEASQKMFYLSFIRQV